MNADIKFFELTPEERLEWIQELNRFQRSCGCDTGAIGAGVGFMLPVLWLAATLTNLTLDWGLLALAVVTTGTVAGGVLGKLYGLSRARSRFRRVTERLVARHRAEAHDHVEVHPVG